MPERTHNQPTDYDRPDGQITGPVVDSIVISARSHGRLYARRVQHEQPPASS